MTYAHNAIKKRIAYYEKKERLSDAEKAALEELRLVEGISKREAIAVTEAELASVIEAVSDDPRSMFGINMALERLGLLLESENPWKVVAYENLVKRGFSEVPDDAFEEIARNRLDSFPFRYGFRDYVYVYGTKKLHALKDWKHVHYENKQNLIRFGEEGEGDDL